MVERPFRFGLQLTDASGPEAWAARARQAEDLGFDVVVVPDHVVDGAPAPLAALGFLAAATDRIRLGTMVLNNDFRHPALLAREAAMLDQLSHGRFELGVGAGHAAPEYYELGIQFDPAPVRVSRLEAAVSILHRLFDGETVTVDGPHYRLHEHRLRPLRCPTLLVGGNGNRVLRLAATTADIVGLTGLGRTLPDGQWHEPQWAAHQIDAQVDLVRVAPDLVSPDWSSARSSSRWRSRPTGRRRSSRSAPGRVPIPPPCSRRRISSSGRRTRSSSSCTTPGPAGASRTSSLGTPRRPRPSSRPCATLDRSGRATPNADLLRR